MGICVSQHSQKNKQPDTELEMTCVNKSTDTITPREYFNIFIKTLCSCEPNQCQGNHYNSYTSYNSSNPFIYLKHNSIYSVGIINNHSHPILAVITIDNYDIGKFRVDQYSTCLIKRPVNLNKEFIFVEKCTELSNLAALSYWESPNLGAIKVAILPANTAGFDTVKFHPCLTVKSDNISSTHKKQLDTENTTSAQIHGGTILGDITTQKFSLAPYLETLGKHIFTLQLLIGNPRINKVLFTEHNSNHNIYRDLDTPLKLSNQIFESAV